MSRGAEAGGKDGIRAAIRLHSVGRLPAGVIGEVSRLSSAIFSPQSSRNTDSLTTTTIAPPT